MFSPCSAKRRASDKDLPVRKTISMRLFITIHQFCCNLNMLTISDYARLKVYIAIIIFY